MLSARLKERLRDPAYLNLHMAAVAAVSGIKAYPWYDSHFLQLVEAAKRYLAAVRPDAVDRFVDALAPLRTPPGFEVKEVEALFAPDVLARIREEVAAIPQARLELHEVRSFGRNVVHDHPLFVELQRDLLPLVGELAGGEVEPGYNFLSLYGNAGRCPPHMDHPVSMYTLDVCIDQSVEWPIWFSDVVDWPTAELMNNFDEQALLREVPFRPYVLRPNSAILFSGSAQWHYREPMAQPGFCTLLFFHYYPKGCRDLVYYARWPELFAIPELQALCDVFAEANPHLAEGR